MSSHPPYESPKVIFPKRQGSWLRRNGLWFIPLMIFVVGIPLLCFSSIFLIAKVGMEFVMGPRDAALEAMRANPQVVAIMGEPIVANNNHIQISDMHIDNDNGDVRIGFGASGPDSSGTVNGKMILRDGNWEVGHIIIEFSNGKFVELGDPIHRAQAEEEFDHADSESESEKESLAESESG